jgi:V/A-type H+-transporting ATPase subunit K
MNTGNLSKQYVGKVLVPALVLAALVATGVSAAPAPAAEGGPRPGPPMMAGVSSRAARPVGAAAATRWDLCMAIAVAIGVPCLAAGYAVGRVGAAALGAASEKPELLARSLLFVALAEGIAIYGLLVAVLLYLKL